MVLFSDSPRSVEPKTAEAIFRAAGPYIARVCVSHTKSRSELDEMISLHPTAIQISHPFQLPIDMPVQVVRVIEPGVAIPKAGEADAVIVDASQGKGRAFDASFALSVISKTTLPVILAGGLTPDNVADAIQTVRPYAVDVASGIEISPGIKDPEKIRAFVHNARGSHL